MSQVKLSSDVEILKISHENFQAEVSLYGGQVLRFKPSAQREVLWLSNQSKYQQGIAIRGGIPLCWPWFGANNKHDIKSDNHGFARQHVWQVDQLTANEQEVALVLTLEGENVHSLWPNAFKLEQTLVFSQSIQQTLSMTNLSKTDIDHSGALHSYFSVSNPENIRIDNLTGVNFDDSLTGHSEKQHDRVDCLGPVDRIYHSNQVMEIVDEKWSRRIKLTSVGCQQWVLWNPGKELVNQMPDIHQQGEQEYVCLEAANAHWQVLSAGETAVMSQKVEIFSL